MLNEPVSSVVFLPRLSITTWWWQQRPPLQPRTTTSCFSTASCPTPPPPLPPSCSSTNREPPQPIRWPRRPTGRATRAAPAAWSRPAASATLTPHTRLHTRAHTRTPGWWPAGAAPKQQWQLFMAAYLTLYRWTDSRGVKTTIWVHLRSGYEPTHKPFDYRVKFWSRN